MVEEREAAFIEARWDCYVLLEFVLVERGGGEGGRELAYMRVWVIDSKRGRALDAVLFEREARRLAEEILARLQGGRPREG